MATRTWLDDELTGGDAFRQGISLLVGGLRRPLVTFGIAVLLAALVGGGIALKKHSYAPKLVLRVLEADRDPTSMPQPKRKLREYVRQALLTSDKLVPLIERYRLYPSLARRNMRAALESFREDIDVDVYQNYFVEQRAPGSEPRSARVAVSYRGSDPDVAVAVTRDLGMLIAQRERALRAVESERAAGNAAEELRAVRDAIANKTRNLAEMEEAMQAAAAPDPNRQVAFVSQLGSLAALEKRELEVSRREAALSLGAAYERHGIGLSFEIADEASLPSEAHRHALELIALGASLAFGLPLVAMGVGAFESKKVRA
jgi:hypothetical protein